MITTTQKIRHKKEGWTGTIEMTLFEGGSSSHSFFGQVNFFLYQDSHVGDEYFEDPNIESLDELEFLETIKKEEQ